MNVAIADDARLADLASSIKGRLITADDEDYDAMRRVFLGDVDPHPGAIIRVANAEDVASVIRFARETDAALAVRSGGHSNAARSSTDGGIVIDVRDLTSIDIDSTARTVWAG